MDKNIRVETLERLKMLYGREGLEPGTLIKIAVKPQWNAIVGTHEQFGIAINFMGIHAVRISHDRFPFFLNRILA